jgi:hypothetical protein
MCHVSKILNRVVVERNKSSFQAPLLKLHLGCRAMDSLRITACTCTQPTRARKVLKMKFDVPSESPDAESVKACS